VIWLGGIVLLVLVAFPLIVEGNRDEIEDFRDQAPGEFADLDQGRTHYQLFGPINGELLVCVHGLTTPSFVWDRMMRGLTGLGFRVLTYDLYGRGYSDRPKGVQTGQFHRKQLEDLLAHLGQDNRQVSVLGFSMGGAIATLYAAKNPTCVTRLVLMAPAGLHHFPNGVLKLVTRMGVLGEYLMLMLYPRQLRLGIEAEGDQEIGALQRQELKRQGFVAAVLASLRGLLSEPLDEDHFIVHRYGIPVLAIWGDRDAVIPGSARQTLSEWNPNAVNTVIKDAGHGLPYTHSRDVLNVIRVFMDR